MKLLTFEAKGQRHLGVEFKGEIIDLKAAHSAMIEARRLRPGARAAMPSDLLAFIRGGEPALRAVQDTLVFMAKRPAVPVGEQLTFPLDSVKTLTPLQKPGKILCSGPNYGPAKQKGSPAAVSPGPVFFSKLPSTVIGPGEAIVLPKRAQQVACSAALAVVIGHRMKDAAPEQAMSGIFGYTILNDVFAHDLELKEQQATLARNFDTFCPLGPWIVTQEDLPDPGNVVLRSFVNGAQQQEGQTRNWLVRLAPLLSHLSQVMTLEPGDIVGTGSLSSQADKPPVFLKAGDTVRLEVDPIGALENPVMTG